MAVTESPASSGDRSHIDVTSREFERRLAAYGHSADEIHHLWDELAAMEPEAQAVPAPQAPASERLLGLGPIIAVYLGLLLVAAASVSLLVIYWNGLGPWGVLALAVVFLTGYLGASEVLRRRDLKQPADVLEAVAVGWVGLATYAVQELIGVWPEGASDLGRVHVGLTTIAVVGLVAARVLLALRPDPLLLVPIAAATTVLAVDLAELAFGRGLNPDEDAGTAGNLSGRQAMAFVLPLGLAWIAAGLWLDVTRRRPYATWAHWCGLLLAGGAIMALIPKTVPGFTLVGVLGATALFFSAFVRHWSFTVIGAAGVLVATVASFGEFGRLAPLAAAVVGLALIFVGLRWSKWRDSIRRTVLARMPVSARDFVTRLAP